MSVSQACEGRKRPAPPFPHEPEESLRKKPKLYTSSTHQSPPTHYLDTFSKICLTKEAIYELDQRTSRVETDHRCQGKGHRPVTRASRAQLVRDITSTNTPASAFLQHCSQNCLKEIKQFAKHGGPDLLDIRGVGGRRHLTIIRPANKPKYPEPSLPSFWTMSSTRSGRQRGRYGRRGRHSNSSSRTPLTTASSAINTRSTGSYDPGFPQRMIDNGIYPDGYEYPDGRVPPLPNNWDEIQQILLQRRRSLSPTAFPAEKYREFKRVDTIFSSENNASREVFPIIQGTIQSGKCVNGDLPFNNLADMMVGKSHKAKPDIYYGVRPETINLVVREALSTHITPSTTDTRPCAPNFFIEAKRPGASAAIALYQACFAGATGARGMQSLITFGQEVPTHDGNAYVISTTYHFGQLRIYAHHTTQPNGPDTEPEYYMNQLAAYALTNSWQSLVEGIAAFRNAAEWAQRMRLSAIHCANAAARDILRNDNIGEGELDDEHDPAVEAGDEHDEGSGANSTEGSEKEVADEESDEYDDDGNPIPSSFTSHSFPSTKQASYRSPVDLESDNSADELALDSQVAARFTRRNQSHWIGSSKEFQG